MASFERNPGKPVRATFYLLVKIEIPDRARSHRQQIEPLDIQSYLPPSTFRMVIFPMPSQIFKDQRIPDVAEENASLSLDYSTTLANGWGCFAHLDAIYAGEQRNPDQSRKQDSAITLNARTGLVFEMWEVALFARNIGDAVARYEFNEFYFGVARPRTIGIELASRF